MSRAADPTPDQLRLHAMHRRAQRAEAKLERARFWVRAAAKPDNSQWLATAFAREALKEMSKPTRSEDRT